MNGRSRGAGTDMSQNCAFREKASAHTLQQCFCHHPQCAIELNVRVDAVNGTGMDTFSSISSKYTQQNRKGKRPFQPLTSLHTITSPNVHLSTFYHPSLPIQPEVSDSSIYKLFVPSKLNRNAICPQKSVLI